MNLTKKVVSTLTATFKCPNIYDVNQFLRLIIKGKNKLAIENIVYIRKFVDIENKTTIRMSIVVYNDQLKPNTINIEAKILPTGCVGGVISNIPHSHIPEWLRTTSYIEYTFIEPFNKLGTSINISNTEFSKHRELYYAKRLSSNGKQTCGGI